MEASCTILHENGPRALSLFDYQCRFLRHSMMMVGGALLAIRGTLLDGNPEGVLCSSYINRLSVKLTAWQLISLLGHSQVIIWLIYLEAHLHVSKLAHFRVRPTLFIMLLLATACVLI